MLMSHEGRLQQTRGGTRRHWLTWSVRCRRSRGIRTPSGIEKRCYRSSVTRTSVAQSGIVTSGSKPPQQRPWQQTGAGEVRGTERSCWQEALCDVVNSLLRVVEEADNAGMRFATHRWRRRS
eukprot:Hpha_TRINITY_DN15467_c1_g7::TRINITY_DN15467_c1_g7_i1::g.173577::m.173577